MSDKSKYKEPSEILSDNHLLDDIHFAQHNLERSDKVMFAHKNLIDMGYGVDERTGKPFTKKDIVLSKIFLILFGVFFGIALIIVLVGLIADLLSNLTVTISILGGITALFLILAIIDIAIRKIKKNHM
ncbi:MAG: hypothetical protein J6M95_00750 [Bacilli bacterium]|nr:hypothetical protein [Bacilli bacterium]